MILGFKTKFKDGKDTNFVAKIIKSLFHQIGENLLVPKIHTIRVDAKKRWKVGTLIHFCTGVRTKNFNNFGLRHCFGVQEIEIVYFNDVQFDVIVDGKTLSTYQVKDLALNDGFDLVDSFFYYFKSEATQEECYKVFRGRLIHWTNLKY